MPFENARVVITGAAGGLGRALSRSFLDAGALVVAIDSHAERLSQLEQEFSAPTLDIVDADLRDCAQIKTAMGEAHDRLGVIDILVACAGHLHIHPSREVSVDQIERTFQVNVIGTLQAIQTAIRLRSAREKLNIVAISSLAAINSPPQLFDYAASKAALESAIDALRKGHEKSEVSFLTVSPGFIRTELIRDFRWTPLQVSPEFASRKIMRALRAQRERLTFPIAGHGLLQLARLLPRTCSSWLADQFFHANHRWNDSAATDLGAATDLPQIAAGTQEDAHVASCESPEGLEIAECRQA